MQAVPPGGWYKGEFERLKIRKIMSWGWKKLWAKVRRENTKEKKQDSMKSGSGECSWEWETYFII